MEPDVEPQAGAAPDPDASELDERGPVGTLFVLLLYLMALMGMWGTLYWLLLSR
jgi:hypothetical protein